MPEEEIVPPVAAQVTDGVVVDPSDQVPVTLNCRVPPVWSDALEGERSRTVSVGAEALIVTADVSAFEPADAMTRKVPAAVPAVYMPDGEMVPPVADQVTAGTPVVPFE
jgi:hypothetical protein